MTLDLPVESAPLARGHINLILNDRDLRVELGEAGAMLLGFLREAKRLTGTKEGCNEGDCGACTVLVGRLSGDGMAYRPVNACIRPLASLDGCHVVTVEGLSPDGTHPVQTAMLRHHGSQCGFCTPGIVMALAAARLEAPMTEARARQALQGNLCRCTGYAPILRAAEDMGGEEPLHALYPDIPARLQALAAPEPVETNAVIVPQDPDGLSQALERHPNATIIAGATDVGLWVTKSFRDIAPAIHIGHLSELAAIDVTDAEISIGATATYSELWEIAETALPAILPLLNRIGGAQVRAVGTVGGNIANGSPIGDLPPAFIALGAELVLRSATGRRQIPLEAFFIAYGKQDLRPGEFVERIIVPRPGSDIFAVHKVSKRREEDITAVLVAARVCLADGKVRTARLAFGGMAATPSRAKTVEAALIGQDWSETAMATAAHNLDTDFTPITDMRASAAYRMRVARNLLIRIAAEAEA